MAASCDATGGDWTIGRLLNWTSEYLARHGVEESRLAGEVLLAHAARCRRIDLYARFDRVLDGEPLGTFRDWVRRAAAREPIAYIVGEKEFFSLALRVTPDVLIPRPETELLVECALDHCTRRGLAEPHLLDLGTGSGCIAIAVLKHIPGARAVGTDVSPAALDVARSNAERHGVADRFVLIQADRLMLPDGAVPKGGFDLLLSNPPYIRADALNGLDATVRKYEPVMALSDGEDGLSFYRSIGSDATPWLTPQGVVMVEVGDGQHDDVIETVQAGGRLVHRETRADRVVGRNRLLVFSPAPRG